MNDIIYLSSDEDDKLVDHTALFDDEKPKRTTKPVSSDVTVEEDDDCVVLDGDPYKTKESTIDTCVTDDDILVLGQKGEVACRDFPHPRHACAKYPFKSTSHDKYCDMCYCYVCDMRAPCLHWYVGISTIDHCHANDKDQMWKNQRQCLRTETLQHSWYSPVNQFGFQSCSPSTVVTSRPNTYIRPGYKPGYRPEQSITFPKNHVFRPRAPQLFQHQSNSFYNGNASPQVLSSSTPYTWTQRSSTGGTSLVDVSQGLQYNRYATPTTTGLQGNSQETFGDYVSSTLASSHNNRPYGSKFSRTSAVPSGTPNQQQQSGRSINRSVLSEVEDWLMDIGRYYTD